MRAKVTPANDRDTGADRGQWTAMLSAKDMETLRDAESAILNADLAEMTDFLEDGEDGVSITVFGSVDMAVADTKAEWIKELRKATKGETKMSTEKTARDVIWDQHRTVCNLIDELTKVSKDLQDKIHQEDHTWIDVSENAMIAEMAQNMMDAINER